MISEKLEYDSSLGGKTVMEDSVPTYRYASSNIAEIKNLLNEIKNPVCTKLMFQRLPTHMRRRAMSHNPKRLPRQYRKIHIMQMLKSGKPKLRKRPSRKYRRKPNNLLKEYLRRQQKNIWLETHIWHAKRFHMINKWGYKIPFASCDKTYRASYRATSKHCLLHDISYYGCIEINGSFDTIKSNFDQLTSPKCGLGIAARTYYSGKREGEIHLFKQNLYPRGALGKVSFLWKPSNDPSKIEKTLWIFVHPSVYREVLMEIITVFQLSSTRTLKIPINDQNDLTNTKSSKSDLKLKFMTKTLAYTRTPIYKNESSTVILRELKDTMNRFRLTGPLSQAVLNNAMKVKSISKTEPNNWFKSSLETLKLKEAHKVQEEFWNNCKGIKCPTQIMSNLVVALNIEDPRINRPQKRSKAIPTSHVVDQNILLNPSDDLSKSSIWDFNLRNKICESMLTSHEYCLKRKDAVVPGERCKFEDDLQPVPILLIQRPGSMDHCFKRLGYSSGWDIIIPSGYGMSVWISLIMWGAKSGGLRETNTIQRELSNDTFLPDTVSAFKESSENFVKLKEKYFRLPPNKRCNYKKLAIASPFRVPFTQLVNDWDSKQNLDGFFILRDRDMLQKIQHAIQKNLLIPKLPSDCLLPISLKMITRGNPGDFSIICLPIKEDFKTNLKHMKKYKNDPVFTEPLRKDDTETTRKTLKLQHKKLLKRLRARRVRQKKRLQEHSQIRVKIAPALTAKIVNDQLKKMCKLWLPEDLTTVRKQCSREVLGYITHSSFSFTEATATAVGYVSVEGLRRAINNARSGCQKMLLVRGTKTRHYRFASFKINCQV